jgi:pterin-4a-carbinolamine dehydratase
MSAAVVHGHRVVETRLGGIMLRRRYSRAAVQTISRQCRLLSSSGETRRPDPMAKRPNKRCDPYGQGGSPLSMQEIEGLKVTVHEDWLLEEGKDSSTPVALAREFLHPDFLSGARFVNSTAAVAQVHSHFPSITLTRRIVKKSWQVVTQIRCHTLVLGGLSTHDFHLAMVSSNGERRFLPALRTYDNTFGFLTLFCVVFSSCLMSKSIDPMSRDYC